MCKIFAGIPRDKYESQTRSVRLKGHSTSIRLEMVYWNFLEKLAENQKLTLSRLLAELYDEVLNLHGEARNFASLLRCVCLLHLERTLGADRSAFPAPERI